MRKIPITASFAALLFALPASAATFDVTTTGDPNGAHCPTSPELGPCSIRAALAQNDADGGGDTIRIPPGTYLPQNRLQPHRAVTITGTGAAADTILDANGGESVFDIEIAKGGVDQGITISHLTLRGTGTGPAIAAKFARPLVLDDDVITDNRSASLDGGGLDLLAGTDARVLDTRFAGNAAPAGGAIATSGATGDVNTLAVTDSDFADNQATAANGRGGGALLAGFGDVTIQRSRFDGNVAPTGGALANLEAAPALQPTIAVADTLFARNQATGAGGAIALDTGLAGSLVADNLTLLDDSAARGGEITGSPGAALLRNTALSGSLGRDCTAGAVSSRGHNLATDATCGLGGSGDREGVAARLDATAMPAPDSPLLDAGDPAGCSPAALNGVARPQGAGCDVGATERPAAGPQATSLAPDGRAARGTVDPGGLATTVTVEYGPTPSYGSALTLAPVGGWLPVGVRGELPAEAVHYRVLAANAIGQSTGGDEAIAPSSTPSPAPTPTPAPVAAPRLTGLRVVRHGSRVRWTLTRAATVEISFRRPGHRGRRLRRTAPAGAGSARLPRHLHRGRYRLSARPVRPAGPGARTRFSVRRGR